MSKLYPIGIQNFESLRKDGYLYVDKTRISKDRPLLFSQPPASLWKKPADIYP